MNPAPTVEPARAARAARVSLEHPGSWVAGILNRVSRRRFGVEMEPLLALVPHRRVLTSVARFEMGIEKWSKLDDGLKQLACAAVAAQIGCSWCIDFGHFISRSSGMAASKLEDLPAWRESAAYTPLERRVLEYAEAMTATPPEVTDEMVARLREELDAAQLIELTEMISVENLRSRTNSALGLTSQGFSDRCEMLPR